MNALVAPVTLAAIGVLAVAQAGAAEAPPGLAELRARRKELAFRPRRIIFNNDGCDVLYYPKQAPLTPSSFLDQRTTALAGTQVGAIAYCSISSGFSFFTHNTRAGTLLERQSADYGILPEQRNIARELVDQGADCLRLVVDYAHAHQMEAFWSMRMNDTHDVEHRPDKPYLLYPPLKEQHPEWLVGDPVKRTRQGRWSSVNYAVPEVRDLACRYLEEVCRSYDVDGIELDFFRHLCYFPSTANGGKATDAEREAMTGLLQHVRDMTEAVGLERHRPILVAVRVPDSVGFSRDLGLDLDAWLSSGLVDILVTTCYFRLNRWEVSVELGHRYGVAVYPCLSDSRVEGATRFRRQAIEALRAEASNAWLAGADGIHVFNSFDPKSPMWRELGAPDTLVGKDKLFFVTVRDGNPDSWLAGGHSYRTLPVLTPARPLALEPGQPVATELVVGEDLAAARTVGLVPRVTAHLRVQGLDLTGRLAVALNGQALAAPAAKDDWLDFAVPPESLHRGRNRVDLSLGPTAVATSDAEIWCARYDGTALPDKTWVRDAGSRNTVVELREGALFIADHGTAAGDYCYFRNHMSLATRGTSVIEAKVKVISGVSSVIFGTGATGQRLRLYPDRVEFYHDPHVRVVLDTTTDFHVYRLQVHGEDVQLLIDGEVRTEGKGCFRPGRSGYQNGVAFGAANSPETGEALWACVRARSDAAALADLVVAVSYPRP